MHLAGLGKLDSLYLTGTAVSDASVPLLAGFKGLGTLNLADTRITEAGYEHLRRAMPDAHVTRP